jgi:hypothetical protein
MPSNPAPRAALSAEGGVARPALHRRHGPTPDPVEPTPDAPVAPKVKGKKRHKDARPAGKGLETIDVVVPLTKPVRRALKAAAALRETTPEELAALVLSTWLER